MDIRAKKDDSLTEEVSALGQRAKGATKDAVGDMIDDEQMEAEGEAENAQGRARQATNNVLDETDGVRGRTVTPAGGYVTGLYTTPESAQRAYDSLTTKHGYRHDDIDVVMSDEVRKKHFGDDVKPGDEFKNGSKAVEGMGTGAAIGGGLGALFAALFAGTAIALPGINLVLIGPIAAALAGAGAGGVTGGLIGALVGAGIPEETAKAYEQGLKDGGIVIGTRARDEAHATELQQDYTSYGGRDVRY